MSYVNVLTNPWFLVCVVGLLLLLKAGNGIRHLAEEEEARRKQREHRVS